MANTLGIGITATDEGFKSALDQMEQSSNKFASSLSKSGKQANTFNGQLRTLRKQAVELAYAYEQLDEQAKNSDFGQSMKAQLQEVLNTAGQMQDIKGDVAEQIKNIASDTMMWDGMKEGIGVVSSGLQGLASIYGMLGGDTKEFTKALVAVNAVQSVSNTIIGIGNALQKQSALMTMLRAAKSKIFTAAQTAENAAVNAGTLAQIKLNLAVLANPYVAAAAAVAALCGAIYLWINANNDVSESERQKSEALQAVSEQLEKTSDEVGKQISAFTILQHEYQKSDGDLNTMKANMSNFDDVCKQANITLKKQSDAEIVLGKLAPVMVKKYQAEARAQAAAAAMAAEYAKILAKVSEIQKRIAAGETIDEGDLKALNIDPDKVKSMFKREAGLDDLFASVFQPSAQDLKYIGKDLEKSMKALTDQAFDAFNKSDGAKLFLNVIDSAQAEYSDAIKQFKDAGVDVNGVFNDDKVKSVTSKAAKHVKSTSKEMNTLLSTLEGCDNVIKKAQQDITKLDHKSADFAKNFIALNAVILEAKKSKLKLIDRSTLQGMQEAKKLAEEILPFLEEGKQDYADMQEEITKLNESIYEYMNNLAKSGSPKALNDAKSIVEDIIKNLPEGSDELKTWISRWKELNDAIDVSNQKLDDLKKGIQEGSETSIQRQIAEYEEDLKRFDVTDPNGRLSYQNYLVELKQQQDAMRRYYAERAKLEKETYSEPQYNWDKNKNLTESYEKVIDLFVKVRTDTTELDKVNTEIDILKGTISWLETQVVRTDIDDEELQIFKDNLQACSQKLLDLTQRKYELTIESNIKEIQDEIGNQVWDSLKSTNSNLSSIYGTAKDLAEAFDDAKDPVEAFFKAFDAVYSITDNIFEMIKMIEKLSESITTLNKVKDAATASTLGHTVAIQDETEAELGHAAAKEGTNILIEKGAEIEQNAAAVTEGLNIAKQTTNALSEENAGLVAAENIAAAAIPAAVGKEAAAEQAAIGPKETAAKANSDLALSTMDLAASQIAAAHASIPIVGPALAAAGIATVTAAAAAAHATMLGLQAFAEGGIVKGSTTIGDSTIIRVNAGEMVLNHAQQANLFKLLNSGTVAGNNNLTVDGNIKVKGSDLFISLNNYKKITNKTL